MPRGYLKRNKDVSKKQVRGGAGHKSLGRHGRLRRFSYRKVDDAIKNECCYELNDWESDPYLYDDCDDDFEMDIDQPITKMKSKPRPPTGQVVTECLICFQVGPVLSLSTECHWHEAACCQCLRHMLVTDAQTDATNYPLRCFHPLCQNSIHLHQLLQHNIIRSPLEIYLHKEHNARAKRAEKERMNAPIREKHEQLMRQHFERRLAKVISSNKKIGRKTVQCPNCEEPRGVASNLVSDEIHTCTKCKKEYLVSPYYATLHALQNIECDLFGCNDGFGRCPNCSILISKGEGCDHMTCLYCLESFDWSYVVCCLDLARPVSEEIYLWW
jgi:hypothetical protein